MERWTGFAGRTLGRVVANEASIDKGIAVWNSSSAEGLPGSVRFAEFLGRAKHGCNFLM